MTNTQQWTFHETGAIPGVANPESPDGLFHAGQNVTVDMDTMTVVSVGLINAPIVPQDAPIKPAATNEKEGA